MAHAKRPPGLTEVERRRPEPVGKLRVQSCHDRHAERLPSRAIFAASSSPGRRLIGFGLVLQHVAELEPCPMCILQRYAFVAIGMVALIAAIQDRLHGVRMYSS